MTEALEEINRQTQPVPLGVDEQHHGDPIESVEDGTRTRSENVVTFQHLDHSVVRVVELPPMYASL